MIVLPCNQCKDKVAYWALASIFDYQFVGYLGYVWLQINGSAGVPAIQTRVDDWYGK